MKKKLALLLSICLTVSMPSAAFAADVSDTGTDDPAVQELFVEEAEEAPAVNNGAEESPEPEEENVTEVSEETDAVTEPAADEAADAVKETAGIPEAVTEAAEEDSEVSAADDGQVSADNAEEHAAVPEEDHGTGEADVIESPVPEESDSNEEAGAASIHVDKDSGIAYEDITLGIYVGEEDGMFPTSGKNSTIGTYTIRWKSSNTKVATVSGGIIKGISAGRAVITGTAVATKTGKEYRYATRRYTVFGELKNFELPNYTVYAGMEKEVVIKTTPNDAIINGAEAKTDNKKLATALVIPEDVPGNTSVVCYIVGVVPGTTKLHVTLTSQEGTVSKTSTITVKRLLSLDKPSYTMYKGRTRKLAYTINDSAYKNEKVVWDSSNTKVATVSKDGTVRALASGTSVIACSLKSNLGVKTTCKITVRIPVNSITLNRANATMTKGKVFQLKAAVAPSNAYNKAVTWKSSDPSVVTVDSTGKMTGTGKGTAVVTCTAKDGSGVKAACKVVGK